MMKPYIFPLFLTLSGCAYLKPGPSAKDLAAQEAVKNEKVDLTTFTAEEWSVPYTFEKKKYAAQAIGCAPEKAAEGKTAEVKVAFAHHRDDKGWDPALFCKGWVAQAFLRDGFTVVGMNRPGFVASEGEKDYVGYHSQAALNALTKETRAKYKVEKLAGAWGYESGAIAAGLQARADKNFAWIILSGSVFDFEQAEKKNFGIWSKVKSLREKEGEVFYESRSIVFDTQGLPKRIVLYHGVNDEQIPIDHVRTFRDSLKTGEFQVTLEELNAAHEIPWQEHYHHLRKVVHGL